MRGCLSLTKEERGVKESYEEKEGDQRRKERHKRKMRVEHRSRMKSKGKQVFIYTESECNFTEI